VTEQEESIRTSLRVVIGAMAEMPDPAVNLQ